MPLNLRSPARLKNGQSVYGMPGTGKTELARVLGKELDCETFEPTYEDEDGEPLNSESRLAKLRACLMSMTGKRRLIVCDEMDDMLRSEKSIFSDDKKPPIKLWLNRLMETLAMAFELAEQEEAVLLLDEVDSLLGNRGQAVRIWEVNQINEMLTQIVHAFDDAVEIAEALVEMCREKTDGGNQVIGFR